MKKTVKLLSVLSIVLVMFVSCKDDDPKDNDFFLGTYKGKITYLEKIGAEKVSNDNGSILVSKLGDKYTFRFSDGIPPVKDIEMEKGKNSVDLDLGGGKFIKIDAHSLNILVVKDGATWTASCKR